jgi:hypothetical protein
MRIYFHKYHIYLKNQQTPPPSPAKKINDSFRIQRIMSW